MRSPEWVKTLSPDSQHLVILSEANGKDQRHPSGPSLGGLPVMGPQVLSLEKMPPFCPWFLGTLPLTAEDEHLGSVDAPPDTLPLFCLVLFAPDPSQLLGCHLQQPSAL